MKKKNKILVTMKALTLAAAVATMLVSQSCQKETAGTQELVKEGETIQVSINADLGDFVAADATKATATPVVRFEWESTDKVDAYYGNNKISGDARISVTPSENRIFAKLSGTIDASGHTIGDDDIITFVYSNGCTVENNLTFNFSNQDATIPFVAYATVKWSEIKSGLTDKILEFKFATSVMKIAATGLDGGAITNATIDGINTKVTLTPPTSGETVAIAGNTPGTITKTGGIDASTDKTRAIFTVGLVPEDANSNRKLTINGKEADLTSNAIAASKSYTTPCAFESSDEDEYVVMEMKKDHSGKLKWAKKNLGASDIKAFGELYSWGEVATKFNYDQSTYTLSISGNLSKADGNDVASAIKGGKWRMPTSQEFYDLYMACGGSFNTTADPSGASASVNKGVYWCTNYDGVAGCLFCDGTNKLFFPAAGSSTGTSRSSGGVTGYYWSSSRCGIYAYNLRFSRDAGFYPQLSSDRYEGFSVRPVSD